MSCPHWRWRKCLSRSFQPLWWIFGCPILFFIWIAFGAVIKSFVTITKHNWDRFVSGVFMGFALAAVIRSGLMNQQPNTTCCVFTALFMFVLGCIAIEVIVVNGYKIQFTPHEIASCLVNNRCFTFRVLDAGSLMGMLLPLMVVSGDVVDRDRIFPNGNYPENWCSPAASFSASAWFITFAVAGMLASMVRFKPFKANPEYLADNDSTSQEEETQRLKSEVQEVHGHALKKHTEALNDPHVIESDTGIDIDDEDEQQSMKRL